VPPGEIAGMTGVPSEQFCGYYVFVHVVQEFLNIFEAEPNNGNLV
jgi:hypothetical protein